ncbi:YHS domain-containing protein [Leptobacterium flavescens]|uniref:YHS domain-containing protein n=1 Tax=Leptobacterium flavescens TaxID=472055 RepID=A0A6P0UUV7_9FLAO|nr:YHS domain-containing (seleno)protein [Leptobacterium flavescens]NER14603.1 YHS domain-containing protein [Leptobacterium flavescens]
MKKLLLILFLGVATTAFAQKSHYNTKKGLAVNGYDVVAYFDGTPAKGDKKIVSEYDGVKFSFSSQENLEKFKANPKKYVPQYGGYCAYAVAKTGKKVSINPETYEIRDGKLFLFYNSWGNNTLESWKEEGPDKLKPQADSNWKKIKN